MSLSDGASNNLIGGTTAGARNVISGNDNGVRLRDSGTTDNVVEGNLIGTVVNGDAALGNTNGVLIDNGATNNRIGGTTAAARNVISGNDNGVRLRDSGTMDNVVEGNRIGTDADGAAALGNTNGVLIDNGAANNTIGGTASGAGNVISGNENHGVQIDGSGATGNVVEGNLIGTDENGTADLGNTLDGVHISDDAKNNTIGGVATGAATAMPSPGPRWRVPQRAISRFPTAGRRRGIPIPEPWPRVLRCAS